MPYQNDSVVSEKTIINQTYFQSFQTSIESIELPKRFNYPFYYDPHPLSILAAEEIQSHLQNQKEWIHNFGIEKDKDGLVIGKMFGVLVVQKEDGEIGYLAAFSGKLAGANHHDKFVPPIFDMLTDGSFFRVGEEAINQLTIELEKLESNPKYIQAKQHLKEERALGNGRLKEYKQLLKEEKKRRKVRREAGRESLSPEDFEALKELLKKESLFQQYFFRELSKYWEERFAKGQAKYDVFAAEIDALKLKRKNMSADLQQQLFDQYQFLNQDKKVKSVGAIFEKTFFKVPPAGAGECAAPKLLQYAFQHQLKPICIAEFWWGQSPKSEIRKHANFYPACRGKCEPILAHMLDGIEMDKNPMLKNPAIGKILETVYEDEHIVIINKPPEFLSVPGKNIEDSVSLRMKQKYPSATGPLIVHRLDMSTSGIMLIAKTKEIHKILQRQFIKRTIKKRYIALLDGVIEEDEGIIDLPLCLDINDRPRQLVSYEDGKSARTKWKVIERLNGQTRIHFFPITGRTHQLRVHSSHAQGLNTPIIGDDLYGTKANRLHLHAAWIELTHPVTNEVMSFELEADF